MRPRALVPTRFVLVADRFSFRVYREPGESQERAVSRLARVVRDQGIPTAITQDRRTIP